MSVNDRQIGGCHYAGEVQHWDIVYSVFGGDYLIGNATKYLARLGKKGGPEKTLEDLDKAIHYLQKKRENLVLELHEDWEAQSQGYVNQDGPRLVG